MLNDICRMVALDNNQPPICFYTFLNSGDSVNSIKISGDGSQVYKFIFIIIILLK